MSNQNHTVNSPSAGRGRGGISNKPAWMTKQGLSPAGPSSVGSSNLSVGPPAKRSRWDNPNTETSQSSQPSTTVEKMSIAA